MSPRLKKFIGIFIMVLFVAFYALIVAAIAPRILANASKLTELVFFGVAGLAWALPIMPLIKWMERNSN